MNDTNETLAGAVAEPETALLIREWLAREGYDVNWVDSLANSSPWRVWHCSKPAHGNILILEMGRDGFSVFGRD